MNKEHDREPAEEEISKLAYEYYCLRGDSPGCAEEDWIKAEEALRNQSPEKEQE